MDNLSSENNNDDNLFKFKNKENDNKEEKPGLFNFKIKLDESKANSGIKKLNLVLGLKVMILGIIKIL